jgi:hypothetical protein
MIPYDRLRQIIPDDQALANKALSVALQQIGGIVNTTLPVLANAVVNQQTTNNLPLISALTEPVPASVANYLSNIAGTNGNSVGVCDVLGVAAGYLVSDIFINTVSTLANTNTAYLTTIYQNMNSVVGNVYGDPVNGPVTIPVGQPAAGIYYANVANVANVGNVVTTTAADNAFTGGAGGDPDGNVFPATGPGLFAVTYPEIGNIVIDSPAQVAVLNSNFNSIGAQIVQENTLQAAAQIDFANLVANSSTSVFSLIYSLPIYGQQIEQGGPAQFWEGVANLSTFTGQAMIGAMREGYNQVYLNNAGITTNAAIPADPNPPIPPAPLIPSTYTAQQAANLVIR